MPEISATAKRIAWIRADQGLRITDFAEAIGISQPTMSSIELGNTNVSLMVFTAVCRRFNVDPLWLGFGKGEPYLNPERQRAYTEAINKASDALSQVIAEINQLPYEKALLMTYTPANFSQRNPHVTAPNLLELLSDPRFVERINPSGEELGMIAAAVSANPALYKFAPKIVFLRLIESYRQSKVEEIHQFSDEIENKKG